MKSKFKNYKPKASQEVEDAFSDVSVNILWNTYNNIINPYTMAIDYNGAIVLLYLDEFLDIRFGLEMLSYIRSMLNSKEQESEIEVKKIDAQQKEINDALARKFSGN